jgi:hypothetical protein
MKKESRFAFSIPNLYDLNTKKYPFAFQNLSNQNTFATFNRLKFLTAFILFPSLNLFYMQNSSTFLKTVCFFLLSCCAAHVCAQNGGVANNWFFGANAGVNFSTGTPVSITGPISTNEGVSVISDVNGNLLFSTDGITVYDRNNTPMPNGFGLLGDPSSTQSGVIVPNPASPNLFYIFTAAAEAGGGFGLTYDGIAYSIVDMTLNGGFGDVTIKKHTVSSPCCRKNYGDKTLQQHRFLGNLP